MMETWTQAGPAAAEQPQGAGQAIDIRWEEPEGFIWLSLENALLSLITLGIYSFWGKTEVRHRIWNAVRINGEPLEYTGTGMELFLGFLIAAAAIIGITLGYVLVVFALFGEGMVAELLMLPLYVVFFWLAGYAIYRAHRYRLRRTRWRGIRGTLAGSPARYANVSFLTALTLPFTLGWTHPWRKAKLHRIITNDTRVGSEPLQFDPEASATALYRKFAPFWLAGMLLYVLVVVAVMSGNQSTTLTLAPFAALLLLLWLALRFHAFWFHWAAANTMLQNARFSLNITPGGLFRLFLGNFFILVLSLGILKPVVQKRLARHFVENLRLDGPVDLKRIAQAGDSLEKTGEGLAEFFDVDAF